MNKSKSGSEAKKLGHRLTGGPGLGSLCGHQIILLVPVKQQGEKKKTLSFDFADKSAQTYVDIMSLTPLNSWSPVHGAAANGCIPLLR